MSAIGNKSLAIVEHFESGSEPEVIETLSAQSVADLEAFFHKRALGAMVESEIVNRLVDWSIQRRWIVCGCRGSYNSEAPAFFPMRTPRGDGRKATLVPLYERGMHASGCTFERPRPANLGGITGLARSLKNDGLGVLSAVSGGNAGSLSTSAQPQISMIRRKRMPSLARVLFTILQCAGVQTMGTKKSALDEEIQKINNFIGESFLDSANKVPARPYFKLSLKHLGELAKRILADRDCFHKMMPQGIIIDVVDGYASVKGQHTLNGAHCSVVFDGRLFVPGEKNTPGPWLVIALVALLPGESAPRIRQAYLHPLAARGSYVLVDSDLERKTMALLRSWQWKAEKLRRPFTITKPLTDLPVDLQRVRPDFILEQGSAKAIVETMGYSDPEYIEQKARMHELMLKIPGVSALFQHDGSNDAELKRQIDGFLY